MGFNSAFKGLIHKEERYFVNGTTGSALQILYTWWPGTRKQGSNNKSCMRLEQYGWSVYKCRKGNIFKIKTGFFVVLQQVISWAWGLEALVGHNSTYLNSLLTAANCIVYNYTRTRPKGLSQITPILITAIWHRIADAIQI